MLLTHTTWAAEFHTFCEEDEAELLPQKYTKYTRSIDDN